MAGNFSGMDGIHLLDGLVPLRRMRRRSTSLTRAKEMKRGLAECQAAARSGRGSFATYHQSFSHVGGEVGWGTKCGKINIMPHYTLLDPET